MNIRYAVAIPLALGLAFGATAADTPTSYQCTILDKDGKAITYAGSPFPLTYQVVARSEEEAKSKAVEMAKPEHPAAQGAKCYDTHVMK